MGLFGLWLPPLSSLLSRPLETGTGGKKREGNKKKTSHRRPEPEKENFAARRLENCLLQRDPQLRVGVQLVQHVVQKPPRSSGGFGGRRMHMAGLWDFIFFSPGGKGCSVFRLVVKKRRTGDYHFFLSSFMLEQGKHKPGMPAIHFKSFSKCFQR